MNKTAFSLNNICSLIKHVLLYAVGHILIRSTIRKKHLKLENNKEEEKNIKPEEFYWKSFKSVFNVSSV